MNINKYWIIIITVFCLPYCSQKPERNYSIKEIDKLLIKNINITSTVKYEGFLNGVNFDRNEFYVRPIRSNNIKILDTVSGKLKRTFFIKSGDEQSPDELLESCGVWYIENKYIVRDLRLKIMLFNEDLKHLYSVMTDCHSYFLDFFKYKNDLYFVIANKQIVIKKREPFKKAEINLFKIIPNRKPKKIKTLHSFYIKVCEYLDTKKETYEGHLWASPFGFEKDGKIYYSNTNDKFIYIYNILTNKLKSVEFSFIKGKKYDISDANKLGSYNSQDRAERFFKRWRSRLTYIPYPEKIYHFGLYDVGKNKIGIVGDLNLNKMLFRLDIIDTNNMNYLESIWLPIGMGFIRTIWYDNNGFNKTIINIDKGLYVWWDQEEPTEDGEYFTKLTKFNLIETEMK